MQKTASSTTSLIETEEVDITNPRTKADGAWKQVLDRWFQPFLLCFWPHIEKKIDWTYPFEDLGQELQSFTNHSMVGKQVVDKLYKVRAKSGADTMVLIHVEVQGAKEIGFEKRLFEYSYKIYDKYQLSITPLVVLSDENSDWRPQTFELRALDDYLVHIYNFHQVKLLDWRGQEESLLDSKNPFESLIAIHLHAQQTRHQPKTRFNIKFAIIRHLFERGWGKDDILSFYTFLDGVMRLPKRFEREYHSMMMNLEQEKHVNYITSAEYFGIQKGMKKGRQEGVQKGIRQAKLEDAKKMREKGIAYAMVKEITGLSDDELAEVDK